MRSQRNPFSIVWYTLAVYGVLVIFSSKDMSPEELLGLTMLFVVICAVESVLIGLYLLGTWFFTHEPCPQCHEHSFRKIKRIDSGIYDDGSTQNPITVEFDEEGNMYVRRYNRKCRSCGHVYFVNEGMWPKGSVQGERTLVMKKEQRDALHSASVTRIGVSSHTRGKHS